LFSMPNIIDLTQAAELNMHMLVKQFIECWLGSYDFIRSKHTLKTQQLFGFHSHCFFTSDAPSCINVMFFRR
jgi:hypothetical protein